MYNDPHQISYIQRKLLIEHVPLRALSRQTGINRKTLRRIAVRELTAPEKPMLPAKQRAPSRSDKMVAVQRRTHDIQVLIGLASKTQTVADQFVWDGLTREDRTLLVAMVVTGDLRRRQKALVVLLHRRGFGARPIAVALGVSRRTCRSYLRRFADGGAAALSASFRSQAVKMQDDEAIKARVFALLHQPPSDHGINRTTWKMADLCETLRRSGQYVCPHVVRAIVKGAGYKWRKAKVVLTSSDPDYAEKLSRVRAILSNLGDQDAFFSIDEFGPFAVKAKPGLSLMAPGEMKTVPQWQKSRGRLIMTAALELSKNQVTHFYSEKKNTEEMIRMLDILRAKYADCDHLYLSWDAASWHMSKQLFKYADKLNAGAGPKVEFAPLPAGAQFLNVIEAVFSGMARAVIHNSNYASIGDAKAALDGYLADRNRRFIENPKRAGKAIWGKEPTPSAFSEANNCKDPLYR